MCSEHRPLAGARVVVTRSARRAEKLLLLLEALGAEAVACPVTGICGPTGDEAERLRAAVAQLAAGRYDWVVLSSANAVERLIVEIEATGESVDALSATQIACVGPATEAALRAHGMEARVVPAQSDAAALGRAVRAAAGDRLASARVLLPSAKGGRTEAADELRGAGAEVDVVTLYRSCTADPADPSVAVGLSLLRARTADVVAFFAPSQVNATFELLGGEASPALATCRVVAAIGQTTRTALTERGIEVHAVPAAPTPEALASAIAMEYAEGFTRPEQADSDER